MTATLFDLKRYRLAALSLTQRLIGMASVIVFGSIAIIGLFVTNWIEHSITHNAANISARHMERLIAPNVQQLADSDTLTAEQQQALNQVINEEFNRDNIVYLQIWNVSGDIVYSTMPSMVGKKYPLSNNFKKALEGRISAEFDNPPHVDDEGDGKQKEHLLEIYWPLRDISSGRVIAVAEFYTNGDFIYNNIWSMKNYSWILRLGFGLLVLIAFGLFISRASRIISVQKGQLTARINELQDLLRQNEGLRKSLSNININITEVNERIAQRLGADLHDGPAQLLTYILMRFDGCVDQLNVRADKADDLKAMRTMLEDTLREVRSLSEGLCLPGLNGRSLEDTIRLAVDHHVRRTNTDVLVQIDDLPDTSDHNLKTCVYRLVQEGLTNAFHHAGSMGQSVSAEFGECLKISVCDQGPGFTLDRTQGRLGLFGLRARVEACGGTFEVNSNTGNGTKLAAQFELNQG